MSSDDLLDIQADYQAGKASFERGDYRKSIQFLERASEKVERASRLGGEIQIWLVTAYEAAGERSQALELCRQMSRHPDYLIRKQSKRLLYILEAPRLKTRPEWLTEIPDLTALSDGDRDRKGSTQYAAKSSSVKEPDRQWLVEPADPTKVNTQDNRFVWVALLLGILTLAGLWWASQVS